MAVALTTEQRKTLASVRKFCAESEWSTVRQGLELLISLDDPVLWSVMTPGLTYDRYGKIEIAADCEVDRRAKAAHRLGMALYCLAYGTDVSTLTELNLSYQDTLTDLSPLPRFAHLKSLKMSAADGIADLSPLAALSRLEHLDISRCDSITDLSPIAGLSGLKTLEINFTRGIRDLGPLRGLVNLESLNLSNCGEVTDLAPLSNLGKLKTLDIAYTAATDLRPLARLPALQELHISGTYRGADIWGVPA